MATGACSLITRPGPGSLGHPASQPPAWIKPSTEIARIHEIFDPAPELRNKEILKL